jgi:hypothetical protein
MPEILTTILSLIRLSEKSGREVDGDSIDGIKCV